MIHFEHLLDVTPSSIYWKDLNGIYLGCNHTMLALVGISSIDEIIGKTDYDLPWKLSADELRRNDRLAIEEKGLMHFEETGKLIDGSVVTVISNKMPLTNESGKIIGIIGSSIDITYLKEVESALRKAKKEAKKTAELKLENELQRKALEEQKKYTKIADQVAHDIRSPVSSLLMIIRSCTDIPEAERIAMREAASRVSDIANSLLVRFKLKSTESEAISEVGSPVEFTAIEPLLVSITLLQLITDKKYEYPQVTWVFEVAPDAHFAFIKSDPSGFKRVISNVINNAVDACRDREACITVHLQVDDHRVRISIEDNGTGIPLDVLRKIQQAILVTSGKKDGHGIGLTQVRETVQRYRGEISFDSQVNKGTRVTLTFPRTTVPDWMAERILVHPNDVIVILDDDTSIHGAWDSRFQAIFKEAPGIQLKHFSRARDTLAFIQSCSPAEKARLFLLTDYELLKEDMDGLMVIEQSNISYSFLVTSHYANPKVQERAAKIGSKILPKQMASEIPIIVEQASPTQEESTEPTPTLIDLVVVDDNKDFRDTLTRFAFSNLKVVAYHRPEELLKNLTSYSKETKMVIDNQFDNSTISGIELIQKLHEQGYSRLYLLSGWIFEKGEVPDYITVIRKDDIDAISHIALE
ncbi:MAG: hypothetical protein A3F41_00340 [Coxiella sp. RIFCSPHIGHO2_12_FULL_44_14]|nr:MAG: hypothetical protein A3F41_00340 [Coxiella sp. RIFCSPHIGHO2_12_FULL_44_14]